jgi:hypothetical protein
MNISENNHLEVIARGGVSVGPAAAARSHLQLEYQDEKHTEKPEAFAAHV